MKTCDLHIHSIYSDGTYTPKEIIDSAVNIGLSAVALCDHNTVDGLPDFLAAANNKNIQAITGTEFSVDYNGTELHLLGLHIPRRHFDTITDLIESLNRAGYKIDYDSIKNTTPNGKFNRAHIAAELTKKGIPIR